MKLPKRHSTVLAMAMCPSVCLSQAGIVSKLFEWIKGTLDLQVSRDLSCTVLPGNLGVVKIVVFFLELCPKLWIYDDNFVIARPLSLSVINKRGRRCTVDNTFCGRGRVSLTIDRRPSLVYRTWRPALYIHCISRKRH